ncbi:MAG: type 4a pilus biogenesis protein PilO [Myxococcales bacterium]|jgi:type IV pilus assembly protein PilO|nr:type 4a pilus biogenesis protein PilO [Myxococcales bacterium]
MAKESALARLPIGARIGVTVGVLVLAGVAYYIVFFSDISSKIAAAQQRESTLNGELQRAQAAEVAYQRDLEELARRRERERELNKVLPPTTEYPAFLSSVQSVANASGITLTAYSPQPEVKKEYYARVPMKLEISGRFHQIAKFFYGIGQSDRIMNIENISMSLAKRQDEDVLVEVQALATAFRTLEDESQGNAKDRRSRQRGGNQ